MCGYAPPISVSHCHLCCLSSLGGNPPLLPSVCLARLLKPNDPKSQPQACQLCSEFWVVLGKDRMGGTIVVHSQVVLWLRPRLVLSELSPCS